MGGVIQFKESSKQDVISQEENLGEVVDFLTHVPHIQGEAICISCKKDHYAVAPVGTVWMECPHCGSMKSIFRMRCDLILKKEWFVNVGIHYLQSLRMGYIVPIVVYINKIGGN